MDNYTQPSKAENKIELGNQKKNSGEELTDKDAVSIYRNNGDDSNSLKKDVNPGHEEETFPADSNSFGQGRTTLEKVKPEYKGE